MGRKGNSGLGAGGGGGAANSTPQEKSIAKVLNQGNWNKAFDLLKGAGNGSTVAVGDDVYTKTSSTHWKTLNTQGKPTWLTTGEAMQEVTAATYNGLKAKVHIK